MVHLPVYSIFPLFLFPLFLTENSILTLSTVTGMESVNSLLAVVAGLCDSFDCSERCGEAGSGAEECWGALPLERCLSFHQALLAIGTGHVQRRGADDGQCFSSWGHREDRADP